ncbi:MAG: FAD-dependent oxidoreductase [Bacteroidota bacterium]
MELSYWEHKSWLSNIDFTVVGSGIVGLNCAIHLKERFPKSKVLVLEKGILPQGASTKNAGFACFGSISEVLSDLQHHSEAEVYGLVKQRWLGIQFLRSLLGDENIGFHQWGGHEIFLETDRELFEKCQTKLQHTNKLLTPIFGKAPFCSTKNLFSFQNILPEYITHQFEGQIDTGKMMFSLLELAYQKGIRILNTVEVKAFEEIGEGVALQANDFELKTKKLFIATNGFAKSLLGEDVTPARAQVLITKPIQKIHMKGTFHFDEGYYYFRNIDNRILFGGGRNLDFKTETTTSFGQTELIQKELERLLKQVILPNTSFEIDRRWSGIMGIGKQKKPIVKQFSDHVYCGVRLGGMGIAIGSQVGKDLAGLA